MIKKLPIILLNLTGIYNYESFASRKKVKQSYLFLYLIMSSKRIGG